MFIYCELLNKLAPILRYIPQFFLRLYIRSSAKKKEKENRGLKNRTPRLYKRCGAIHHHVHQWLIL